MIPLLSCELTPREIPCVCLAVALSMDVPSVHAGVEHLLRNQKRINLFHAETQERASSFHSE